MRMFPFCLALGVLSLTGWRADAQQTEIVGSLSNFDVHQGCFENADNFELDFLGAIDPDDFLDYFRGWGAPPRFDDIRIDGVDLGAEVLWLDRANPVPFCEWRHFGVQVDPSLPPTSVQAYWTRLRKVLQIPVPFQWWIFEESRMVDVLAFSETFDQGPVFVVREWAVSTVPLPLEALQFDATPVVWNFGDAFELFPGESRELPIETPPGIQAALVRYSVQLLSTGEIVTRFVTEGVRGGPDRQERRVLVNFDLHNGVTGASFDNLELDFFGDWIEPWMVTWWYDEEDVPPPVIPAWGVDPLLRRFPPGLFPGMPGGLEVTWLDKFDPFEFCHTYHFGLEFDAAIQGGGGALYATDTPGALYRIDPTTGAATFVCQLPWQATELEYNPSTQRLVVQGPDGTMAHQEFDLNCAPLGPIVPNGWAFNGLEWVGATLYGAGIPGPCAPSTLFTIDVNTGATFPIGATGHGPISGMAYDPGSAKMYGVTGCWQQGPSLLLDIDLLTGLGRVIGNTGVLALGGLAFGADGNLYGVGNRNEGGNFYRIDPATGASTLIGPTGTPGLTGLTLTGSGLPSVQAYWTQIDTCQVPVPWQFWQPLPGGPIRDIILLSDTWPQGPVQIDRQFTVVPFEVPLPDLTWDGTETLPWQPVPGDPVLLGPGRTAELDIAFQSEEDRAALVRYTVTDPINGEVTTRFVNEAIVLPYVSRVEEGPDTGDTGLEPNLPNPFGDWTVLVYRLAEATEVSLAIHDVNGRRLVVVEEGAREPGLHTVRWEPVIAGERLPSGVYFAVLRAGGETHERKIVVKN